MKEKTAHSLLFLLLITSIYIKYQEVNADNENNSIQIKHNSTDDENYSMKWTSSVIVIDSDNDFISQGYLGNGTETNPFLIQDLEIETVSEIGIAVFDTTKCFVIQNCTIIAKDVSIYVFNNTGKFIGIQNNLCTNSDYWGIYAALSSNLYISENTFVDNKAGIGMFTSDLSIVSDNLCYDNEYGIVGEYIDNIKFIKNSCLYNIIAGLDIAYGNQLLIHQNLCTNTRYAIDVYGTSNSILSENILQYADGGFANYGLENVTISGNELNYNYIGICNVNSNNVTINDNQCLAGTYGMWIDATHASKIQNNYCTKNSLDGMYFDSCSSSYILNNTCNENSKGIRISCLNKNFDDNLQLVNNTCNFNILGIKLEKVDSHQISRNYCNYNSKYGLLLVESSYNFILDNTFQQNKEYGVYISDGLSAANKIYGNYFIGNNLEGTDKGNSQCFDNSYSSRWYNSDTESGNYYNDYSGEGVYEIDGESNKTDPYPMFYDYKCYSTEKTRNIYWIILTSILSLAGIAFIRKKRLSP